jgi:hypothetical protein
VRGDREFEEPARLVEHAFPEQSASGLQNEVVIV